VRRIIKQVVYSKRVYCDESLHSIPLFHCRRCADSVGTLINPSSHANVEYKVDPPSPSFSSTIRNATSIFFFTTANICSIKHRFLPGVTPTATDVPNRYIMTDGSRQLLKLTYTTTHRDDEALCNDVGSVGPGLQGSACTHRNKEGAPQVALQPTINSD
jgi:hypothetical protein